MLAKVDLDWGDEDVFSGKIYPDTTFVFTRMAEATWEMVAPSEGERVVDIGCGRGMDASELARRGGRAIGLDPSARMMREARRHIKDSGVEVCLVRAIGEALPFKGHSLDKIMCKGALDHFANPVKSMEEIFHALKPGGELVIAIANFESLSCRLGRLVYPIARRLPGEKLERPPWEIPPDHTCRFDYRVLKELVERRFRLEKVMGVSLLWTAPYWGRTLALLPGGISRLILALLDRIARRFPSISDVIIVKCTARV